VLKTIRSVSTDGQLASRFIGLTPLFWHSYLDRRDIGTAARAQLIGRSILHVAACSLARVDGKSPVEYLDCREQAIARSFAREALLTGPTTWNDLCRVLGNAIGGGMEWRN
jgi:5-methylthioribose kinase